MKIFALNLCLEFLVKDSSNPLHGELTSYAEIMDFLFRGTSSDKKNFFVEIKGDHESWMEDLYELQANPIWREVECTICFLFSSESRCGDFLEEFKDMFKDKQAAGGIVENEQGAILAIYNRNKWTFPKGGVEWGEEIDAAAIREVMEETGLDEVSCNKKIGETYHTFKRKKNFVWKTTHWFHMNASEQQALTPQLEENIEEVKWMGEQEWSKIAEESYPLNRHLLHMFAAEKAQM